MPEQTPSGKAACSHSPLGISKYWETDISIFYLNRVYRMPVFSLYLSTQISSPSQNAIVPLSKDNLSNCSWRVDYDNLFKGAQHEYKHCRVRFNLVSAAFNASTPPTTDWTNYSGYIAITTPTMYNAETTVGTILGLIHPTDCPISGTGIHCINVSTLSDIGVDISIPTGIQQLNVQMINDDSMSLMGTFQEYSLLLTYDLYN